MGELLESAHGIRLVAGWQQADAAASLADQSRLAGNAKFCLVATFDDCHRSKLVLMDDGQGHGHEGTGWTEWTGMDFA